MKIKMIFIIIFVVFTATITVQNTKAVEPPSPPQTDITGCGVFLGIGKNIPPAGIINATTPTTITNKFYTNDEQYSTELDEPVEAALEAVKGIAYKFTTKQNISINPISNIYRFWITKGVADTYVIYIIYKNNHQEWEKSAPSKFSDDDLTLKVFKQYVQWHYLQNIESKCQVTSTDPTDNDTSYSATSITSNGKLKTVSIKKLKSDNTLEATFYLVAHGNYTRPDRSQKSTGFIYRSGKKYILVDKNGNILQTFTTGDSDWAKSSNFVPNFAEPVPIVSSSETVNHFKLPSGGIGTSKPGSNIIVNFNPPLKDDETGSDLYGVAKDVTIEAQLDGPKGPFINKNTLALVDNPSGTYHSSTPTDGVVVGFSDDMLILEKKDLEYLYGVANVPPLHHKALTAKLIICAHKTLGKNNGHASGFVTLELYSNGDGAWDEGKNIKKIADQGSGVFDWSYRDVNAPLSVLPVLKIPVIQKASQTCGTSDDEAVMTQIGPKVPDPGFSIADAILKALQVVAQVIQNFIVYVVKWAIGVASNSIPI